MKLFEEEKMSSRLGLKYDDLSFVYDHLRCTDLVGYILTYFRKEE